MPHVMTINSLSGLEALSCPCNRGNGGVDGLYSATKKKKSDKKSTKKCASRAIITETTYRWVCPKGTKASSLTEAKKKKMCTRKKVTRQREICGPYKRKKPRK